MSEKIKKQLEEYLTELEIRRIETEYAMNQRNDKSSNIFEKRIDLNINTYSKYAIGIDPVQKKALEDINDKIHQTTLELARFDHERNIKLEQEKRAKLNQKKTIQLCYFDGILLDHEKQSIQVGNHRFEDFNSLFKNLQINDPKKKTQMKGGILLLYSIAKHIESSEEKKKILISELIGYQTEFRNKWQNRLFEKKGKSKKNITQTDCESANKILLNYEITVRLKLSKDKKDILIVG